MTMLLLEHLRCESALIILTYNAEAFIPDLLQAIQHQKKKPDCILVMDSTSRDATVSLVHQYGIPLYSLPQREFNHGGTRRFATQLINSEYYIFLTQDAIPAHAECFEILLNFMRDARHHHIGCAYGRQLPRADADLLGYHARVFNYPEKTTIKTYRDRARYGIKTCFNSNSFAIYRQTALFAVDNFPKRLSMCEDMYVAARLLLRDYAVAYLAEAKVVHSHNFSLREEFKRYILIGKFHRENPWIRRMFAGVQGEGMRYAKSEWIFLLGKKQIHTLFVSVCALLVKWVGFKCGLQFTKSK